MTNQNIVDEIEELRMIRTLPDDIREKLLSAIWNCLCDNRPDPQEEE